MAATDYTKTDDGELDLGMTEDVEFECEGYGAGAFQARLFTGAWSGATVVVEKTLDGVKYFAFGEPISFTADGFAEVASPSLLCRKVRFRVSVTSGASGKVAVTAHFREI